MTDVQALIEEARAEVSKVRFGARQSGKVALFSQLDLIGRLADALDGEHQMSLAKSDTLHPRGRQIDDLASRLRAADALAASQAPKPDEDGRHA